MDEARLARIEARLDKVLRRLDNMDSRLDNMEESHSRTTQTLYGPHGRNGLYGDVKTLKEAVRPAGTVSIKTMAAAIGALGTLFGVIVALMVGMG